MGTWEEVPILDLRLPLLKKWVKLSWVTIKSKSVFVGGVSFCCFEFKELFDLALTSFWNLLGGA